MTALQVNRLGYPITTLGPGRRLAVWLQGCPLACRGCMSRDTWDPAGGRPMEVDQLVAQWERALLDGATGLTVSGGEPLADPEGLTALLTACDHARAGRDADILVYTGYTLAELDGRQRAALRGADALITGRFEVGAPTTLIWRGSANQRLIARTRLGVQRYRPYLDHRPDRTPVQVTGDADGLYWVGVPRRGELPAFEAAVRSANLSPTSVSWRPADRGGRWRAPTVSPS